MEDDNKLKENIEKAIKNLIAEFKENPEKFLTEDDVRSYLYHLLMKDFDKLESTFDNEKSIPVHCEVRWYGDEDKKLKYRSDIVIFEVSSLKTRDTILFKLPSKSYFFDKPKTIIEVKLRRKKGDSDKEFKKRIENDRKKLLELSNNGVSCLSYLIVFDKKKDIKFKTLTKNKHREFYIYAY